jgi:glycosyltransferase involved in cell wall biosynthesis
MIVERMKKEGFEIRTQAFFGLMGGKATIDGIETYPRLNTPWGEDGLVIHGKEMQADVVFTFQDVWPFDPNWLKQVKYWIPYTPIDGLPLSPAIKSKLGFASEIVSISKFGKTTLQDSGFSSTYIPCAVDTKVMYKRDKEKAREMFKLPQDKFIFGVVAANKDNPSRKSYQEIIDAFTEFSQNHDDAIIFIHSNLVDSQGGFPIKDYCAVKGILNKVFMLDNYTMQFKLDREALSNLYSCFDILLNPASSEGFGVTIIEAQACGVPVIVNNCQSMPELCGSGEICEVGFKRWGGVGQYFEQPNIQSLLSKMNVLYKRVKKDDKGKISRDAIEFAKKYDIDLLWETKWLPYLLKLEARVKQSYAR